MSYIRDTAIVLKNEPFREHDAWLTLYGKENGKMIAVARGARRMDAKSLGHLEPLAEIDVMIAEGSVFDKLAVAHLIRPRLRLRNKLEILTVAGAFADIVDALTKPGIGDPRIFGLLVELLDVSESCETISAERSRLILSGASLKLLDELGYAPHLNACIHCREPLQNDVELLDDLGGLLCDRCGRDTRFVSSDRMSLPASALRLLRFLRARPLNEILKITAPSSLFLVASLAIESLLRRAPFIKEPHGPLTVSALVG